MTAVYLAAVAVLLASVAMALWRVVRGPTAADRMLGAQLVGTGGIGAVLLLSAARGDPAVVDVALVLALLAAFAAVAFAKAVSVDGAGDPEDEDGA
jgi:multicomponent Na+:H+ antiporter subunit F